MRFVVFLVWMVGSAFLLNSFSREINPYFWVFDAGVGVFLVWWVFWLRKGDSAEQKRIKNLPLE